MFVNVSNGAGVTSNISTSHSAATPHALRVPMVGNSVTNYRNLGKIFSNINLSVYADTVYYCNIPTSDYTTVIWSSSPTRTAG